jgi:hypothetical protein
VHTCAVQALLGHASVQLFVTHGGLNSTYEGVTAGLPLVVLPYFADQPINAMHVVNKGLGTMVGGALRACWEWGGGLGCVGQQHGRRQCCCRECLGRRDGAFWQRVRTSHKVPHPC